MVLIICSINFFELQAIKGSAFRYVQFAFLLLAIVISMPYLFMKGGGFLTPVRLIFISAFISIFIASFTWDQTLIDSLGGTIPVLVWGVLFYLLHIAYPIEKIERIVLGYGLLYLVLYFFQFTHPETGYFVKLETVESSRGIVRIVFPGRGLFYFMSFMAINKLTTGQKNKWLWVVLSALGIIVTVMQVTRQFIGATMVIYAIHFLRGIALYKKVLVAVFIAGAIFVFLQTDNPIVRGLTDTTQEQAEEDGTDNVRYRGAMFFLTDLSKTTFNRIFGNGVPYGETSGYNRYYGWLIGNYGFWLADVGIFAVYAMFGVFAVLGYFLIWIKSFFTKLPDEYQYLKYYLWFLLLTSLSSDTIYSSYDLIATVMIVYIFQVVSTKKPEPTPVLPVVNAY
ncbi:hypothetical protein [Dyadobacter luticola]|uniref:O-antigen ligase family protein n=1 Tax=Dyadobacter luticola TaxID=1979387 RepID=A0A5R9L561_9BACT|nr:hypothetical protein [Dyadobacter luticola]TLV03712.1 hypothetical protein FEN17_08970 [Dyadobacter luticola]